MKNMFFMSNSKEQVKTRTHILFEIGEMKCHDLMTENICEDDELMMMEWWQRKSEWFDIYRQTNDPLFSKK